MHTACSRNLHLWWVHTSIILSSCTQIKVCLCLLLELYCITNSLRVQPAELPGLYNTELTKNSNLQLPREQCYVFEVVWKKVSTSWFILALPMACIMLHAHITHEHTAIAQTLPTATTASPGQPSSSAAAPAGPGQEAAAVSPRPGQEAARAATKPSGQIITVTLIMNPIDLCTIAVLEEIIEE